MITYFHRNKSCGYSIHKVFSTLEYEIAKYESIKDHYTQTERTTPLSIFHNILFAYKNRDKYGVNHISGQIHDTIIGLIGCRKILTIHDLVFIRNASNILIKIYKLIFWVYIPIFLADRTICISKQTQKEINRYIHSDKIQVIYNPIDPKIEFIPKSFNEVKPTILHVGTFWNKNLKRTIIALKDISCHLRIIGELDNETIDMLKGYKINYSNKKDLTDDEIRQEYIHCDIVNFPSIYEGFGMPIIEGQKTGRVVITSQLEPMIEISGNAVEYVNPYDINSIRDAYLNVINHPNHREELIRKGLINVERFDVRRIAKQYMDIYNELRK